MLFIEHGHSNTQFFKRKVVFSLIVLDIFVNMKANLDEFQAPFVCKKVHENAHSFEIDSVDIKCEDIATRSDTNIDFMLHFIDQRQSKSKLLFLERANLSAFRAFVWFALVWFCLFPLPLGVWEGLRFVIVALPGLFSYLFSNVWKVLADLAKWPFILLIFYRFKVVRCHALLKCYKCLFENV